MGLSPIAVTYTSDITPVSRITFSLAKWLSVCLWTKWLWVWVTLQSLILQIPHLFRARSTYFDNLATIHCGFTKKCIPDMIRTYNQLHCTECSHHNSILWPVWLNGWVFVYKLSGCGFESCCGQSYTISGKTKDPILRKLSNGRLGTLTERQTRVISQDVVWLTSIIVAAIHISPWYFWEIFERFK